MAPEQVSGRRGDVRTDIYSLGTILYEMLTGELPYCGPKRLRDDAGEDHRRSAAADRFRPDLDPHLEEIILHAIERNAARPLRKRGRDAEGPARSVAGRDPTARAKRLHPRSLAAAMRRGLMVVAFFVFARSGLSVL